MAGVNTLDNVNKVINITAFSISVLLQGAFLIRFKFKADKAALGILFTYLIVNASRIFVPEMLFSKLDILITPASTSTIFSLLYFFVFEMSFVRALMTIHSPEEYLIEKKVIKIKRGVCIVLQVFVFYPCSLYLISNSTDLDDIGIFVMILRAMSMMGVALYCFPLCIINLNFFIR